MRDLPAHPRGERRGGGRARQPDKLAMSGVAHVDRRLFLVSVAAVGGSLALGFEIPFGARAVHASSSAREITAWIVIDPDEPVIIRLPISETSHGSFTALPTLTPHNLKCTTTKTTTDYKP